MKRSFGLLVFLSVFSLLSVEAAFAQNTCVISVNMVNNDRYVYSTDEECDGIHSHPFGNWGISSNVGNKIDGHQFEGWSPGCNPGSGTLVEWNSCSNRAQYRTPQYLNFPNPSVAYPYPANGYPFSDSYAFNDTVPPYGNSYNVDQYSPCGANVYGSTGISVGVSQVSDTNCDGVPDSGGCKDLDGYWLIVQQNYMTAYELDQWAPDDLVESVYFPDVHVTLTCNTNACYAVGDNNHDGWIDDIQDGSSPEYKYPTLYQDDFGRISYATDPGVPYKRIDAAIRIGSLSSHYSGYTSTCGEPPPDPGPCYLRDVKSNRPICY
jgi:hypothetical protein